MTKYSTTARSLGSRKKRLNFGFGFLTNKKFLGILTIFVLVFSVGIYMVQVNNMATKGYEIRLLEKQINELENQNQKLSLDLLELQSMHSLKNRVGDLNFVEAETIHYVNINTALAQR